MSDPLPPCDHDECRKTQCDENGNRLCYCPFCGSSDVAAAPRFGFPVSVVCVNCGATGPSKLTALEANSAWNSRYA